MLVIFQSFLQIRNK